MGIFNAFLALYAFRLPVSGTSSAQRASRCSVVLLSFVAMTKCPYTSSFLFDFSGALLSASSAPQSSTAAILVKRGGAYFLPLWLTVLHTYVYRKCP